MPLYNPRTQVGGGSGDMLSAIYDPANGARQVAFSDEIGGGGGLLSNIVLDTPTNVLPIDMTDRNYVHVKIISPTMLANESVRLLFNEDTTTTNYTLNTITTNYHDTTVTTTNTSNLGGMGGAGSQGGFLWDVEIWSFPGTNPSVSMKFAACTTAGQVNHSFRRLVYSGAVKEGITSIDVRCDNTPFPVGTIFMVSEF